MNIIRIGSDVKVRGTTYKVVGIHNASSAGSKFFGKFRFFLTDGDGNLFTAFGKTVTGNSRLSPETREQAERYGIVLPGERRGEVSDGANREGGAVMESIAQWIARQEWSDEKKAAAVAVHERRVAGRSNPLTLGQWRSWAEKYDEGQA